MTGIDSIAMLNQGSTISVSEVMEAERERMGLSTKKTSDGDSFDSIYNAAIGLVDSTNTYIEAAQQAEVDFALGNLSSAHELGVVQQKANLALQYTVAIRDKLLEAYKEIMNMQI